MPPDPEGDSPAGDDPVADAAAKVDAELAQTPESIRVTPEFKALEKQLRSSARALGTAKLNERKAREEAETYRQAAEAEKATALEAQISTLDPAVMAAYEELANLGAEDPVAAARKFAELMSTAQSLASAGTPGTEPPATTPPEGTVPASTPPPPGSGVNGDTPLTTQPGEDFTALRAQLNETYAGVVERNQDPIARGRVTMKDRAAAIIAYVGSSYLEYFDKGGKKSS